MGDADWQAVVVRYLQADQHSAAFEEARRAFCDGLEARCATALRDAASLESAGDPAASRVLDRLEDLLAWLAIAHRSAGFADGREISLYRACYEQLDRLGFPDIAPDADSQLPDELMPAAYHAAIKRRPGKT